MVKVIGVKDTKGNNVMLMSHNNRPCKDFWTRWSLVECFFTSGSSIASMIVREKTN